MSPDDFKRLAAAGLSVDQIALVMEMMERDAKSHADVEEARKAKGRDRMVKWRLERHRNVTVTQPSVAEQLTGGDAHVDDKTSTSENIQKEESKKVRARGSRLPSDFVLPDEWAHWAQGQGLPAARIPLEFQKLCNWAANAPDSKALKRDWFKAWQNWVLSAIDALPQNRAPPASQAAPSMSQIFSVVRDTPNAIEPGPPEDRSGFRAAIQDLRPARTG